MQRNQVLLCKYTISKYKEVVTMNQIVVAQATLFSHIPDGVLYKGNYLGLLG